ncbi:unnamed protein product [Medioppia subpectinata]|uniref:Nuclear condensin complex subunit 3 C-terminal domain-containing protein n=1 Tax=Medioppia subpectinata TaxID=1979941 RepID=A0A7R9KBD6_9ACAR|nr:unnamed protein product [Medioppia subpectinata]CAG2100346.1 unnamed protein product [Medioppia subpectinata]
MLRQRLREERTASVAIVSTRVSGDEAITQLVDEFRDQNLRADRVFSVSMNVENVFLWRYLCQFCKTNGIENKDLKAATVDISVTHSIADPIVNGEQTIQQSMATSDEMPIVDNPIVDNPIVDNPMVDIPIVDIPIVEMPIIADVSQTNDETEVQTTVDLFDLLVPDVPIFCAYLEKYVHNVTAQHLTIADALDFEFIFNQFMKVSLLLDIGDDAQRKILVQTMRSILIDNQIGDKFHGYITPVMKCLATNGFTDAVVTQVSATLAQLSATLLEDMEADGRTEEAPELADKIKTAEEEVNGIRDRIAANTSLLSQSSQTSLQSKSLPSFADHPKSLMSCLQVFSSCLEFGNYTEVNAVMQTHIEKVVSICPNIPPQSVLYIFLKDIEEIKIISLQSIFDSLCEHGITIFDDKVDKNGLTSEDNSKARQLAFDSDGDEDFITSLKQFFESQLESISEDNSKARQLAFDSDGDEDFITSLKQFFESQLESNVWQIRETTVQGVAKLLIHSRLYSPELLSKMIVIWFTPEEKQEIVQFIGDFLRQYALAESLGVIVGQSALQDSFLPTLEILYEQRSETPPPKRINAENLIKFFLNLIDDNSHQELAKDLAKRIVDCDQTQTKFAEDYLLLAVTHLNLVSMSNKDLKAFGENMEKIALKFETSKSKAVKKRLVSIVKKIENRGQQLSADTAFEQDFEPIDDIDDTLDQMSAADVTPPPVPVIRTDTTADESADPLVDEDGDEGQNTAAEANDSDAESFNTCPESQSPPQKRRRLTTDGESFFDTNEPDSVPNGLESHPLFDEVNDLETNTSELSLNESMAEVSAEPVAEVSAETAGEETAEPMAEDSDEALVSTVTVGAEPTNESTSEYVESSEATGAENVDQIADECMLSTISTGAATADEDPSPEPDPRLDDPFMTYTRIPVPHRVFTNSVHLKDNVFVRNGQQVLQSFQQVSGDEATCFHFDNSSFNLFRLSSSSRLVSSAIDSFSSAVDSMLANMSLMISTVKSR